MTLASFAFGGPAGRKRSPSRPEARLCSAVSVSQATSTISMHPVGPVSTDPTPSITSPVTPGVSSKETTEMICAQTKQNRNTTKVLVVRTKLACKIKQEKM